MHFKAAFLPFAHGVEGMASVVVYGNISLCAQCVHTQNCLSLSKLVCVYVHLQPVCVCVLYALLWTVKLCSQLLCVCLCIMYRVRTDLTACAFHCKHW